MNLNKTDVSNNSSSILKDKRTFFVGDRVIGSQTIFLLITAIIVSVFGMIGLAEILISFWYLFLLIMPLIVIILTVKTKKKIYFKKHWINGSIPIFIIWISLTFYLGVVFDYYSGIGKTFFVSMSLVLYYVIGYLIARKIRKIRLKYSKKSLYIYIGTCSMLLILLTLIIGYITTIYALRSNNIEHYGEFSSSIPCILGISLMISGIAIVLSLLLNYMMLFELFKSTNYNVEDNSPNRLYFICLLSTMILMFIFWLCLELLFPLILGGDDNSGGGGGGDGGSSTASSQKNTKKKAKRAKFEQETFQLWSRYHHKNY